MIIAEMRDQLKMTRKKKLYECTCCGKLSDEVLFCKTHDTFSNCILPKRKRRCNIIICDSCYSHLTHINHIIHKYGCFDVLENAIRDHLIEEGIYKK